MSLWPSKASSLNLIERSVEGVFIALSGALAISTCGSKNITQEIYWGFHQAITC